MGVEVISDGVGVDGLNPDWPLGRDPVKEGDNHIRAIKQAVKNQTIVESKLRNTAIATAINNSLGGSVTMESYGAVAGEDSTDALVTLVENTLSSGSKPQYLISETVEVVDKELDLSYCTLVADGLAAGSPVLLLNGAGLVSTTAQPPNDINVVVYGDGVYSFPTMTSEPTVNGVELFKNKKVSDKIRVTVSKCLNGLVLRGDSERKGSIEVYASSCDTAVCCLVDPTDETTDTDSFDEIRVLISGGYCRTWLQTLQTEESGEFIFNVENSIYQEGNWGVVLGGGKNVKMSGLIRGHNGNLFWCRGRLKDGVETTTWRDSVHFNDMTVIQCDNGIAFSANRVERLKGTLNLYDCTNETGPTAVIEDIAKSAGFNLIIDKCLSLYGLYIGSATNAFSNGYLTVNVTMGDVYTVGAAPENFTALYIKNAVNSTFDCIELQGNIDIAGANNCTFILNKSFVTKEYGLIGSDSANIILRGNYSAVDLTSLTWKDTVQSITIDSFDETGTSMTYSNGSWKVHGSLSVIGTDILHKSSFLNYSIKRVGLSAYNETDGKLYIASGSEQTSSWTSVDGTSTITPGYTYYTTNYIARIAPTGIALTTAELNNIDRLFAALFTAELIGPGAELTHLYALNLLNADNARYNLLSDTATLINIGTATHAPRTGYSNPNLDESYLSGNPVNADQYDMSMGIVMADVTENSDSPGWDAALKEQYGFGIRARNGTGGYVNFGQGNVTSTSGDQGRSLIGTRWQYTTTCYSNGVAQSSLTSTESLNPGFPLMLAMSERVTSVAFVGKYLTVKEVRKLDAALQEFKYAMLVA